MLRTGGMPILFDDVYAPSTLDTLLREFSFGHSRQLESVLREHLAALAKRTELLGRDRRAAASFVAFDVLTVADRHLRGRRYRNRRKRLRRLVAAAVPPLMLMPATRELAGAQAWMRDHLEGALRTSRSKPDLHNCAARDYVDRRVSNPS